MSLVDYASSSDDDAELREEEKGQSEASKTDSSPPRLPMNPKPVSLSNQQPDETLHSLPPSIQKLPDVSLLLNSPAVTSHLASGGDHSSRVAAAMAESASRKRHSNGLTSGFPRSKFPRGNLPHSRNVPDTGGGLLVPPQLKGRSNVVTEDLGRLFVKKQADASS